MFIKGIKAIKTSIDQIQNYLTMQINTKAMAKRTKSGDTALLFFTSTCTNVFFPYFPIGLLISILFKFKTPPLENQLLLLVKRRTKNAQRHRQLSCHGI
jgi:hypothetical protein